MYETSVQRHMRLEEYSRILQCQNAYRREAFRNNENARLMERSLGNRASVSETLYGLPTRDLAKALGF